VIIPYLFPLFPTFYTYTTARRPLVNVVLGKICLAGPRGEKIYYNYVGRRPDYQREIDRIPFAIYATYVSLYRVHFKWREKEVQLTARSLDLTHPYFVSIKDLVFEKKEKIIINPAEDDLLRAFGGSKHLMIPFQTVSLIEEIDEDSPRLRAFSLVEGSPPVEG
jgi:hypothetical protein